MRRRLVFAAGAGWPCWPRWLAMKNRTVLISGASIAGGDEVFTPFDEP